jgi:hypothetical protein
MSVFVFKDLETLVALQPAEFAPEDDSQQLLAKFPPLLSGGQTTLLVSAQQEKLESGATVRIDSTVSATLMHPLSRSHCWRSFLPFSETPAGSYCLERLAE